LHIITCTNDESLEWLKFLVNQVLKHFGGQNFTTWDVNQASQKKSPPEIYRQLLCYHGASSKTAAGNCFSY